MQYTVQFVLVSRINEEDIQRRIYELKDELTELETELDEQLRSCLIKKDMSRLPIYYAKYYGGGGGGRWLLGEK